MSDINPRSLWECSICGQIGRGMPHFHERGGPVVCSERCLKNFRISKDERPSDGKIRGKWVYDGHQTWSLFIAEYSTEIPEFTLRLKKNFFALSEDDDNDDDPDIDFKSKLPSEAKLWAEKSIIDRAVRNFRALGIEVKIDPNPPPTPEP